MQLLLQVAIFVSSKSRIPILGHVHPTPIPQWLHCITSAIPEASAPLLSLSIALDLKLPDLSGFELAPHIIPKGESTQHGPTISRCFSRWANIARWPACTSTVQSRFHSERCQRGCTSRSERDRRYEHCTAGLASVHSRKITRESSKTAFNHGGTYHCLTDSLRDHIL